MKPRTMFFDGSVRSMRAISFAGRSAAMSASCRSTPREADHPGRHLPVDLDVTVGPRLVDAIVDHRLAGEVPEVVLEKPQHRVGDDRVVLLVLVPGRRGVVELARRLRQWDDVPA